MRFILIFFIIIFMSCSKDNRPIYGHKCKWTDCPYKGIVRHMWHNAVLKEAGEEGSDIYCIDILHLQYPEDNYDELEDKLFKP